MQRTVRAKQQLTDTQPPHAIVSQLELVPAQCSHLTVVGCRLGRRGLDDGTHGAYDTMTVCLLPSLILAASNAALPRL
jgi:hypothetical protein